MRIMNSNVRLIIVLIGGFVGGVFCASGVRAFIEEASTRMPPNYSLQTNGKYWRFVAVENDRVWTNDSEFEEKRLAVELAWRIHKWHREVCEWHDVR